MKKLIFILLSAATSCFAATPTWDTITINQAIAGVWSSTATTIASGTLVLPKSIPDGTLQGTAAIIEGGTMGDANWSHLLITDTDKSVGRGGSISFATGSGETIDPLASIKAIAEGDAFGSLGFFTRPDGGTNTQNMTILSTGFVGIGTAVQTHPSVGKFEVFGGSFLADASNINGISINEGIDGVMSITAITADFSGYIPLNICASYGFQLYLTTGGFVGIGSNNPTCTFEVSGGAQATSFRGTGNYGGAYVGGEGIEMGFSGGGFILAYDRDNSNYEPVEVSGSQVSLTAIDGTGNITVTTTGVGVGTASPSQALDVVGYIKTDTGVIFPAAGTITIDTTVYYPHDTAGVLSWTTTP